MVFDIKLIFVIAAAGAAAYGVYALSGWILAYQGGASRVVADYYHSNASKKPGAAQAAIGSREYRIALAFSAYGLDVSGWERLAFYLAYALLAVIFCLPVLIFSLPYSLLLAALFIAYVAIHAVVDSKWDRYRGDMEKEIPTLLIRLSSLLKANPNLIASLDSVADGLDPDKPLQGWIQRFASRLQASGKGCLDELQRQAQQISPALLLVVVEIGRLWETGGKGYSDALRMASKNLASLVETRSQANAVAAGAWGTTRTILIALGLTLGMVLVNPISKPVFQQPLMQIALLGMIIWGGLGYWQIKDAINSVTE
jgi:Flp pilus assembly protein TadB